jgi:Bacterial PH domain
VVYRNNSRVDVVLSSLLMAIGVADLMTGFPLGGLFIVLGLISLVQTRRTLLVVDDEGVLIRNLFNTRELAWDDLKGATAQRALGSRRVDIIESGGRIRRVRLSGLLDRGRTSGQEDEAADAINERINRPKPKAKRSRRRR